MDPLSDVLSLLKPRSYVIRALDAAGHWSLHYPPIEGVRCYACLSGECWLVVDGDKAMRLTAGDCVLLTRRQNFRLASDPTLMPEDAVSVFGGTPNGGVTTINGGGQFLGLGGFFTFAGQHGGVLLALLPPVVHVRKDADRAALRWSMERVMEELRETQPGGALIAQHLGHMMLVLALRLALADGPKAGVGWFYALADKQISAAITAMHSEPAHRWTLQSLAARANMSRSTFALRFKETVGESPMEYLARWRMMLAGDKLLHSKDPVSVIAFAMGYESESAFSAAFRRIMGCSPRQYVVSTQPTDGSSSNSERSPAISLGCIAD